MNEKRLTFGEFVDEVRRKKKKNESGGINQYE